MLWLQAENSSGAVASVGVGQGADPLVWLCLLGGFRLVSRGQPVPIRSGGKTEALLAHLAFRLAGSDRYLWDFRTLPQWRGRGLYPKLLQSILRNEGRAEARFWIINAPENLASARGIDKAGFRVVGDLAVAQDGRAGLVPTADPDRASAGAKLLGVPVIQVPTGRGVSPCWCCVMDALHQQGQAACWPAGTLEATPCSCGRPEPETARAVG